MACPRLSAAREGTAKPTSSGAARRPARKGRSGTKRACPTNPRPASPAARGRTRFSRARRRARRARPGDSRARRGRATPARARRATSRGTFAQKRPGTKRATRARPESTRIMVGKLDSQSARFAARASFRKPRRSQAARAAPRPVDPGQPQITHARKQSAAGAARRGDALGPCGVTRRGAICRLVHPACSRTCTHPLGVERERERENGSKDGAVYTLVGAILWAVSLRGAIR